MSGLIYLDIAIGVIFLILVFSLFAGAILEAVAAIFNMRARTVREGIRRMIGDAEAFDEIWSSPLIDSLRGPHSWLSAWAWRGLAGRGTLETEKAQRNPSEIPPDIFRKVVLARLGGLAGASPADAAAFIDGLRGAAAKPGASVFVQRAAATLEGVEAKGEAIETAIDGWYDATRNRFAGWYVRRTQFFLFAVGLVMAGYTNTDPLAYMRTLRENTELRQQVVVMAEATAALRDLNAVRSAEGVASGTPDGGFQDVATEIGARAEALSERMNTLGASSGWGHCGEDGATASCVAATIAPFAETQPGYPSNPLLGWLLLAVAVMLGSQFWLDTLRRFVSIRSAASGILATAVRPAAPANPPPPQSGP